MDEVASQTGSLDLFISNAGYQGGLGKSMALKDFQVTNVDYTGFFICTKFAPTACLAERCPGLLYRYHCNFQQIGVGRFEQEWCIRWGKIRTIGLTQSFALETGRRQYQGECRLPGQFPDGPLWSTPRKACLCSTFKPERSLGPRRLLMLDGSMRQRCP